MSKFNVTKFFNAARIISSWSYSTLTGLPVVWGYPFSVGIELTNRCNLGCLECAAGSGSMDRPAGFMSKEVFEKIIAQLGKHTINTMFYFQGESMLHPLFFHFLSGARNMGVIISTNGHFIDSESAVKLATSGARKIIVSLDGYSQEVYSKYRAGGDVNRVKEGIILLGREVGKTRNAPQIVIQVLVNSYNEAEIGEIRRLAGDNNATLVLKSLQIISQSDRFSLLPSDEKYRRYSIKGGRLKRKGRLGNRCFRLWTNPVITWEGSVVPCCFDKNAKYVMGNLQSESFTDIWRGQRYRDFRKKVLQNRAGIEICRNCTAGLAGTLPV